MRHLDRSWRTRTHPKNASSRPKAQPEWRDPRISPLPLLVLYIPRRNHNSGAHLDVEMGAANPSHHPERQRFSPAKLPCRRHFRSALCEVEGWSVQVQPERLKRLLRWSPKLLAPNLAHQITTRPPNSTPGIVSSPRAHKYIYFLPTTPTTPTTYNHSPTQR